MRTKRSESAIWLPDEGRWYLALREEMPQCLDAVSLAQHYKRLQEQTLQQLREEARKHRNCATEYALLQKEHLGAMRRQAELQQALHGAAGENGQRKTDHESSSNLLRSELRECEAQLLKEQQSVQMMQTSRRLLVDEVMGPARPTTSKSTLPNPPHPTPHLIAYHPISTDTTPTHSSPSHPWPARTTASHPILRPHPQPVPSQPHPSPPHPTPGQRIEASTRRTSPGTTQLRRPP